MRQSDSGSPGREPMHTAGGASKLMANIRPSKEARSFGHAGINIRRKYVILRHLTKHKKQIMYNTTRNIAGIVFAALLLVMTGCNNRKFTIEGTVAGAAGDTLYLENNTLTPTAVVDSVILPEDGSFRFKHTAADHPEFYRLRLGESVVNLLVDSTVTSLRYKGDKMDFATRYTIEGSDDCRIMQQVSLAGAQLKAQVNRLMQSTDGNDMAILRAELTDSLQAYKERMTELILQAPSSPVAYFIVMQQVNGMPIFNTFDPADNRIIAAVATAHDIYAPGEPRTEYIHDLALQGIAALRAERKEAQRIDTDTLPETDFIDIALYDMQGHERRLSDITKQHRAVLLDFTAYGYEYSPEYNMLLASLYKKYHTQGLEIYQVSFDIDEHHWKVSADNLPWICVHDAESLYSSLIQLYNIQSLPTCFIIVDNGEQFLRPTSDEDLEKKLGKIFG